MTSPLTEEEMTAVQMSTVDPCTTIGDGRPVPALTTLLYGVCHGDNVRFTEACRLVALFIEQGRRS